jgi:DnaJ-class molecular chaperone
MALDGETKPMASDLHAEAVLQAAREAPCHRCNGTGLIAIRSRDGTFAFPGPVPDDARGYAEAVCWGCDGSGVAASDGEREA